MHRADFGIGEVFSAAGHIGWRAGGNPKRIIACRRAVEQFRPRRGVFVGMAGVENVLQIGFQSALISVWQVTFISQFYRQFAPVSRQITVAVHTHGRKVVGVILGIHFQRQTNPVKLAANSGDFGFFLGPRQRR